MKKYILSTLASALIIPGLGQILNHHLKKGLIILGIVFFLFIAGTIKLALVINSLIENQGILDPEVIMLRLHEQDLTGLWILITVFGFVWLYSILDAFFEGKKIDKDS